MQNLIIKQPIIYFMYQYTIFDSMHEVTSDFKGFFLLFTKEILVHFTLVPLDPFDSRKRWGVCMDGAVPSLSP